MRADYDPARQTVSLLSLGPRGWIQISSFIATGLLMLAFAAGLRRCLGAAPGGRWAPRLLAGFGAGLIGAGVFVADPANGYPPGTPFGPARESSWQGSTHDLASLLVFVSLPAACFVLARAFAAERGRRGLTLYTALSGAGTLSFALAMASSVELEGLFQRIAIAIGWAWVGVIGWLGGSRSAQPR